MDGCQITACIHKILLSQGKNHIFKVTVTLTFESRWEFVPKSKRHYWHIMSITRGQMNNLRTIWFWLLCVSRHRNYLIANSRFFTSTDSTTFCFEFVELFVQLFISLNKCKDFNHFPRQPMVWSHLQHYLLYFFQYFLIVLPCSHWTRESLASACWCSAVRGMMCPLPLT